MGVLTLSKTIDIDLSCYGPPSVIYAKQGDIGSRFVTVKYRDGCETYPLDDVSRTEIRIRKPDGRLTVNCGTISDDTVTYPLTASSLAVQGKAEIDFVLYDEDGNELSSRPGKLIIVGRPVGNDDVESTNEYKAFVDSIGGLSFKLLTQDDYDILSEHDEETVYFVGDLTGYTIYIGDVSLTSSGSSESSEVATEEEVNEMIEDNL